MAQPLSSFRYHQGWMDESNAKQFRSFINLPMLFQSIDLDELVETTLHFALEGVGHVATLSLASPSLTAFFTAPNNCS